MIIMSAGDLDFSVASQISLISVIMGIMFENGAGVITVSLIAVLLGLLCGLVNSLLVSHLHVVSVLATLMSAFFFRGLSNILSQGLSYTNIPSQFRMLAQANIGGISVDVWVALVCLLAVFFIFNFMYIGKYIRALGSSGKDLMLQAGISENKVRCISYMLGSSFIAIAAAMLVARQGMASSDISRTDYGILGMCAVYIGGITPGVFRPSGLNQRATVIHAVAGAFVISIIQNGVQIAELNQYFEDIVIGIVILITVVLRNIIPFFHVAYEKGQPRYSRHRS